MDSYYGFVINEVHLKKDADKIVEEVAQTLHSKLTIFDFQISEDTRSLALAFEKPQKTRDIECLFPEAIVSAVYEFENRISRNDILFITSIPDEFETRIEFEKVVNQFSQSGLPKITAAKGIYFLQMTRDFDATCLGRLLPEICFNTGRFRVDLKSSDVPLIHIKSIPSVVSPEDMVSFIEEERHVKKYYVQPKDDVSYSMNVLFENNEDTYAVIESLNYSSISSETQNELLMTHFKMKEEIDKMKEWELTVKGIKPDTKCYDISQFFQKYGHVFSVFISKKPVYARVVFEEKKDAQAARDDFAKPDSDLEVTFPTDKSYRTVFVQNIPYKYKEEDVRKLFPDAVTITIKPSKYAKGLPPTVILTFKTEEDGELAVRLGNKQYVRKLRLFCVPYIGKDRSALEKVGIKANPPCTLFVGNIKSNATYEEIVQLLGNFGKMERVTVQKEKRRRDAAAIVQYANKKSAEAALKGLDEFIMDGMRPEPKMYVDPQVRAAEAAKKARENARKASGKTTDASFIASKDEKEDDIEEDEDEEEEEEEEAIDNDE